MKAYISLRHSAEHLKGVGGSRTIRLIKAVQDILLNNDLNLLLMCGLWDNMRISIRVPQSDKTKQSAEELLSWIVSQFCYRFPYTCLRTVWRRAAGELFSNRKLIMYRQWFHQVAPVRKIINEGSCYPHQALMISFKKNKSHSIRLIKQPDVASYTASSLLLQQRAFEISKPQTAVCLLIFSSISEWKSWNKWRFTQ